MSAISATLRGRAAAQRLMVDACVIKRQTGSSTDRDTGIITPTYTTIYTGICKVQAAAASAGPSILGEAEVLIAELQLHIPVSADTVQSDDIATITASVLDPKLVGRVFRIRALSHKTFLTARRFSLIEITS